MSARTGWTAAVILALFAWGPARAQDSPESEVVKVEVDLVTVNVSVTDGDRRPVTGLRAEDFHVSDEGLTVGLEFFEDQGPSSVVFVVDASSSMGDRKWKELTAGLKKFLARAGAGNDYTLVAFGDRPRLVAEGVGAEELWRSFRGLKPSGHTALYDALLLGLEALGRAPRRHKALVLLSDGQDNRSRARLLHVRREALARRATIYAVGVLRRRTHSDPPVTEQEREGKGILNRLAAATGGLAFFPEPDDIRGVLDGINADLSGQYTLGYYAPDVAPGWRNVRVSLPSAPSRFRLRYQQLYLKR
jgi:VWFA-related protein